MGVDFFIFLFSFLVAFILLSFKKIKAFFAILILLLGSYSFLLILNNISYTKPLKEKLSVLVMQDNFDNDQKDDIDDVLMRLKKYSQILQNFPQIDFAIFPESSESIDFYLVENEIKNYYALIKYPVFFGGYVKRANKTYSVVLNSKRLKPIYKKTHLIPFGEYMPCWAKPLKSFFPSFRMENISPFKSNKPFEYKDINLSFSICYEHLFDDLMRDNFKNGNILINISDLAWFNRSWVAPYMIALSKIRAMEFGKPFIYSVNGGISALVLPNGTLLKQNIKKGFFFFVAKINPYKGETPYAKYGLKILLLLGVIYLLVVFITKQFLLKDEK